MQTTQQNSEIPSSPNETQHILKLLELHGIKTDQRSYITRAATILPSMGSAFTVPALARKSRIPRSKGYPTINQLKRLCLVKPVPKVERPPDWKEYTRSMRKRFNQRHGLPKRGIEPQRYTYTPNEALWHLKEEISSRIRQVDRDALRRINEITGTYKSIETCLSSHQR